MSLPGVTPVGRVSAGLSAWRRSGELFATVAAKVTFSFARGSLTLVDATPLTAIEIHHRNNPTRSIREAADLVPFKRQAELTFVGNAFTRSSDAVEATVRIALHRAGQALVDKTLQVVGDRSAGNARPAPFTSMPLVYERSLGGIGNRENPLGSELPNVFHTQKNRPRPAGFAPISWTWSTRKVTLSEGRKSLDREVADLPATIDAYFQAAPADQRFDRLDGGEILTLEGLTPHHTQLELTLPLATAMARVVAPAERPRDVPLRADTLFVDGEAQTIAMVFRGIEPFSTLELLKATRLAAGVWFAGQPVAWPDLDAETAAANVTSMPLQVSSSGTVILADVASDGPVVEVASPEPARIDTVVLSDHDRPARSLPFPKHASTTPEAVARRSVPGAPWAGASAEVQGADHALVGTLAIEDPLPPAREAVPPAAPLPAPKVIATKAAKWRVADPEPPPPPIKAARSQLDARQPAPPVKKSIYGKFGK